MCDCVYKKPFTLYKYIIARKGSKVFGIISLYMCVCAYMHLIYVECGGEDYHLTFSNVIEDNVYKYNCK